MRGLILGALLTLGCSSPSTRVEPPTEAPAPAPAPPTPLEEPAPEAVPEPAVSASFRVPPITRDCTVPAPADVPLQEGIVYTHVGGQSIRLDLAVPSAGGPHPWVVVMHGGGWSAGERSHVHHELRVLAGLGYAAASLDYRLLDDVRGHHFPAQIADVRCAVRFLRREAARFNLDPDRAAALGYSAGAHLALLLGTAPDVDALDQSCVDRVTSPAVGGVLAFFGPADLRAEAEYGRAARAVIRRLLGSTAESAPELAALASPIVHVDGEDAPTLLLHGTADTVVPVEQSRMMRAALSGAGVPVQYVEVPGGGHGFRAFPRRPPDDLAVACTSVAFLEAALAAP